MASEQKRPASIPHETETSRIGSVTETKNEPITEKNIKEAAQILSTVIQSFIDNLSAGDVKNISPDKIKNRVNLDQYNLSPEAYSEGNPFQIAREFIKEGIGHMKEGFELLGITPVAVAPAHADKASKAQRERVLQFRGGHPFLNTIRYLSLYKEISEGKYPSSYYVIPTPLPQDSPIFKIIENPDHAKLAEAVNNSTKDSASKAVGPIATAAPSKKLPQSKKLSWHAQLGNFFSGASKASAEPPRDPRPHTPAVPAAATRPAYILENKKVVEDSHEKKVETKFRVMASNIGVYLDELNKVLVASDLINSEALKAIDQSNLPKLSDISNEGVTKFDNAREILHEFTNIAGIIDNLKEPLASGDARNCQYFANMLRYRDLIAEMANGKKDLSTIPATYEHPPLPEDSPLHKIMSKPIICRLPASSNIVAGTGAALSSSMAALTNTGSTISTASHAAAPASGKRT